MSVQQRKRDRRPRHYNTPAQGGSPERTLTAPLRMGPRSEGATGVVDFAKMVNTPGKASGQLTPVLWLEFRLTQTLYRIGASRKGLVLVGSP